MTVDTVVSVSLTANKRHARVNCCFISVYFYDMRIPPPPQQKKIKETDMAQYPTVLLCGTTSSWSSNLQLPCLKKGKLQQLCLKQGDRNQFLLTCIRSLGSNQRPFNWKPNILPTVWLKERHIILQIYLASKAVQ